METLMSAREFLRMKEIAMGFRFKRSMKIAPGVRLNFGKKSSSISFGTRGARYTINSNGKRTKSVGIPGTGVSYTSTSGSNRGRRRNAPPSTNKKTGSCMMTLLYLLAAIAILGIAVALFSLIWIPAIILLIVIPFIKIEKRAKIISEITVVIIGILSAVLFFSTVNSQKQETGLSDQNNTKIGIVSETELLTEIEEEDDPLGFNVLYNDSYCNDVTGKWRLSKIAEDIDIEKYALNYYKNYFNSNDEIHIIVNFTRNTTTRINVMGNLLDVSIMDYVDGEEHDAKIACSGTLLSEYHVNIDNGNIEPITEAPSEPITETETPAVYPTTRFVTDTINVRDNPGTDSAIIGSLTKSDSIQVQSVNGKWAQIQYNGTVAYVAAEYLSETQPQTEPGERLVWLPSSGTKYHPNKNCSGMDAVRQVTVDEALALGYEPCSKC